MKDSKSNKRSNYKKRPKKKSSKDEAKASNVKVDPTDKLGPINNDPNWYIYDRVMFDGVITMPTLDFKGTDAKWPIGEGAHDLGLFPGEDWPSEVLQAPTVAGYYLNPSPGYFGGTWDSNAINMAARTMYADLSASTAKTANYGPQDVSTLILALGQIIAMVNHCKRMYGITNYYHFYNRTVPKAMMALHGVNATGTGDWAKFMPSFRSKLNQIIASINTITFPRAINYFNKCEYVYNNVFVDRDDNMPTYQFMLPWSTWTIDETGDTEGTVLRTTAVSGSNGSVANYDSPLHILSILSDMVEAVLTSATYNYIYGDIINLVNRNVWKPDYIEVAPMPVEYVITPLYSEQFNWQIMNATITGEPMADKTKLPGAGNTVSNDVFHDMDTLAIKYAPAFLSDASNTIGQVYNVNYRRSTPVRIPDTNMSDDEFVELLVYHNEPHFNKVTLSGESNPRIQTNYVGLSDYYVVCVGYLDGSSAARTDIKLIKAHFIPINAPSSIASGAWNNVLPKLLNIVHAPLVGYVAQDATTLTNNKTYIMSKLGSYTFINERALSNLRFQTFLGLFVHRK